MLMKIVFLDPSRRKRRLFCGLISLLLAVRMAGQAPAGSATTVQDVVYRADGTPASGTLVISWPAFTTAGHMIASLSVYCEARAAAADPEAFVRALARHWATDPGYAEKVLYLYRGHGLDRLDEQSPVAGSRSPVDP